MDFENGFVVFFTINQKNIEKNQRYKLYKKSKLQLMELDEFHGDRPIRTIAKFIAQTSDPVYLGNEIKTILDSIYRSDKKNPQALFNLRYIYEK
ncbi:hypothetical protein [Aquimarina intermedia]|nr:hypothetical protein [Aquimarina intermedia]